MKLTNAPIVVKDQDRALAFYTEVLGWEKRADYQQPGRPRWLTVAPKGQDLEFILVQGESKVDLGLGPEAGSGGHNIAFASDDCQGDYEAMKARGVDFTVGSYTKPVKQGWGTSATFKDPDGNIFALVQPNLVGKIFTAVSRLRR
jgi:predicted enzyme related to lactoylglutathione lyase